MKRYKKKLHTFEKSTTVKSYKDVERERSQVPSDYTGLTVTLDKDGEECSLSYVREQKNSIAKAAGLEPHVLLQENIHSSAVVLTVAFPHEILHHVQQTLRGFDWSKLGILPHSVKFHKLQPSQTILSKFRNLFVTNKGRIEQVIALLPIVFIVS